MVKLSHIELSEICKHLCQPSPKKISRVYGGDIHYSLKIEFNNSTVFAKLNKQKQRFLKFEKYCLNDLQKYINDKDLTVPKVHGYLEVDSKEILLMEWIDMKDANQRKLGKGIGEMHLKSNNYKKKFGYPVEGFIGKSKQVKGWDENWPDFFINFRLQPQLLILEGTCLTQKLIKQVNTKIRLVLSDHNPMTALIHGDLWSGNVGVSSHGKGVIFDPACWWADSESEIAMTQLFGGFKREFYEEYFKVIPKKKGLDRRIIIYNFYHILNHANMFKGSYLKEVDEYIKMILKM